ncbi:hypothetical protein AAKU55_002277 [Oxalobacteraceae bacterium GrIS 1.11]
MKMTSKYAKISQLARSTRWVLSLALVGGALFWAALTWQLIKGQFGGLPQSTGAYLVPGVGFPNGPDGQLLAAHPMLVWGYGTLALGITGYGLLRLVRLMRMYEAGAVFDRQAPAHLSAFAICIVLRELLDIVALPLLSLVTPDGMRSASFNIDSSTMHVLFITLLFFLMSRIMAAAYVVADDNERII